MITFGMSRKDVEVAGQAGATKDNLSKILNDFYLYTDKEELSIGRWLANNGYWEAWITSWFTKTIKPGDVCIDIGANYGYYTRLMEKLSGPSGKVIAIEANPKLAKMIEDSIKEYPIENSSSVEILDIAISDKTGTDILSISEKYIGGSSIVYGKVELPSDIPSWEWNSQIEVKTDTLDNVVDGHVDIIKIDIEGAEPMAWPGMKNTLKNTEIVVVECGGYSPAPFLDDIFNEYSVSIIDISGEEIAVSRKEFESYEDLVMAVLRRK